MTKSKKPSGIFKQRRIPYLGELVDSVFTAMPALSLVSLMSTMIILYEVTKKYLKDIAPWLNIFYFFGALIVIFIPILLVVYKFILPSVWNFRATLMSHLDDKVDDINEKLDKLLKEKGEDSSKPSN